MLVKYLIFLLTPLSIVHLTILITKNKNNKFLIAIIVIAIIIIITGSLILLKEIYFPIPHADL
jgi:hypothetical protein